MAKTISSLNAKLGGNVDPFSSAMRKARGDLDRFKSAGDAARSMLLKFGAAIGGAFTVRAAVGSLRSAADEMDRIGKSALSLGVSTEVMAGLEHAAKLSGVEAGNLTSAMGRLLNVVGEAANGSTTAQKSLSALGLTAAQLQRLTPDQMLGRVADRVMAITDPAQRAAAMIDIFGRSGTQLIPMLAQGSAGLDRMRTDAEALGLTFGALDFANVEKMNDSITRLGQAWEGLSRRMAARLAPDVGAGLDWLNDMITPDGAKEQSIQNALKRAQDDYNRAMSETADATDVQSRTAAIENQIVALNKLIAARTEAMRTQTVDAPLTIERMIRGDFETSKQAMTEKEIANEQRLLNLRREALREELADNKELIARTINTGNAGAWTFGFPGMKEAAKTLDDYQKQAERLKETLRTPAEVFQGEVDKLNQLLQLGLIDAETYERGLEKAKQSFRGFGDIVKGVMGDAATATGDGLAAAIGNQLEQQKQMLEDVRQANSSAFSGLYQSGSASAMAQRAQDLVVRSITAPTADEKQVPTLLGKILDELRGSDRVSLETR